MKPSGVLSTDEPGGAPELLRAAQSPLHWLLQSALLDRDERYLRQNYVYLTTDTAAGSAEAEAEPTLPEPDPALLAQLERTLTFRYAHAQAIDLPSKVTATELKRLAHAGLPPAGFFGARAQAHRGRARHGHAPHAAISALCRRAHAGGHRRAGAGPRCARSAHGA